jgi:phenylpyruvate tautomerase PptA (4-oxalocrotonate tautomerase family)
VIDRDELNDEERYGGLMPHVLIEVRRESSRAEEIALIEAVHGALQRAFRIPPEDRHVRLLVHEPHRFAVPPGLDQPDRFTQISIDAFEGRSLDAKRDLYRQIVESLEPLGIPATNVSTLLREVPVENWGIRGGRAAIDIDLGFEINV